MDMFDLFKGYAVCVGHTAAIKSPALADAFDPNGL
jgi:hypothetical protein